MVSSLLHHPAKRLMRRFLTLTQCGDRPPAIETVPTLRHQPFQSHQAGMAKQIRPYLALFGRIKRCRQTYAG